MGRQHTEVPGVAAFAAQARPARFENAVAFALHTFAFGFNLGDGDRRDRV